MYKFNSMAYRGTKNLYNSWLYGTSKIKKRKTPYYSKNSNVICRDGQGNIIEIVPASEKQTDLAETRRDDMRKVPTYYEKKLIKALKPIIRKIFNLESIFQHVIYTHKAFFIVDIYIPKARICVEVDGRHHKEDTKQIQHDAFRNTILKDMKLTVIRFTNQEVHEDIKEVINKICSVVKISLSGEVMDNQNRSTVGKQLRDTQR